MDREKYDTLKNALIIEKNDKLLEEFKKLMKAMDKEENDIYSKEYNKYDYMSLTIEEEEEKVSNIVNLIKKREKEHNEYEDDYSYITGEAPDFLTQVLYIDKLKELEIRLNTINEYLAIKDRIVNLSINIKDYKKELESNKDNRRLQTKLNKSTKKVNDLLNSLKKENILILLYEFCIIDTFDKHKVDNGGMLKNILSSKVKKKENQVKELKNEENKIKEEPLKKEEIVTPKEDKVVEIEKKDVSTKDEERVIEVEPVVIEDNTTNNEEDDYFKRMIPEGMPILEQIGTVKPVSMLEKLEKAQEEEDLTIPSMGILNHQDNVEIDSNDYLRSEK
jgi:hypothetical protein